MTWGNPIAGAAAPAAEAAPVPGSELSPQEWKDKREALLIAWTNAQDVLARAKETEMEARKAVADFAFPVTTRLAGKTNNQDLPNGYVLKLGDKLNHKITADPKTIEKVETEVVPKISNEAPFLFERIVKISYDFSVGEYNKLDKDNPAHVALKAEIDKLIEVSRGTPSLEIKPPKETL
jgi:hypothetical protein